MKALVAFILATQILVSSLLPGFSVDQSTKLVDLVQHYQQHRKTVPNLSFLDFIGMHYGSNSEHQKHPNHSHQKLPAVSHAAPAFTAPSVILLPVTIFAELLLAKTACFRYTNFYSFVSVSSLINPPRR
ncbi:hypothetical protein [Spirosoma pomorum]